MFHTLLPEDTLMQSRLHAVCADLRQGIAVPPAPLGAIRHSARSSKTKRRWVPATIAVSVSLAAVCAAAVTATNVSFTPNGGLVLSGAIKPNWHVTGAQAQEAARADGLMLPAGLPDGTVLTSMIDYGQDTLALSYDLPGASRRDNHMLWIVVTRAEPNAVDSKRSTVIFPLKGRLVEFFKTAQERVYLDAPGTMTRAEIAAVKAAMSVEAFTP
jgi:hypothetical protein